MLTVVLGALAAGYLCLLVATWVFQDSLVYFPDPEVPPAERCGLRGAEDVTLTTEDGKRLHGWFVAPAPPTAPAALLVLFHGNAGNISNRAWKLEILAKAGFAAFGFDYRSYGRSEAAPCTEAGLYADGRAAVRWARERAGTLGIPVVYVGESLGCAVAVELALADPPAALALEAPFSSLGAVGRHHYPFLPVGLLLRPKYDNLSKIGRVKAPLFILHGEGDRVIPPSQGRALFEAATGPKAFRAIPGADHNEAVYFDAKPYVEGIREALRAAAPAAATN